MNYMEMYKRIYKLRFLCALLCQFFLLTLCCVGNISAQQSYSGVITKEIQQQMSPREIYQRLIDGNERFTTNNMKNRDLLAQASTSSIGQYPVAIVLNCMDSRTPPEVIFDQGVGDIFAIRIAGNVLNDDILGGMEFGTKLSGAKLIAVIGHTRCGAITGACKHAQLGHLTSLLQKIQPAVVAAEKTVKKHNKKATDCDNQAFINSITKQNVLMVMQQIPARSPIMQQLIKEGKLGIVGGIQDLATGKVTFFTEANLLPKESESGE